MKVLILGGTRFLGRHLAEIAVAEGHDVTLFNRGQSADAPASMESLKGDRDGGLDVLRGRTWDAVIDTCGYVPRVVRASAELLSGSVGHYAFVSSLSALADATVPGQTEDAAVRKLEDETVEEVSGETYGGLKALCERAVEDVFPRHALVVRPGLIVGPHDTNDRFPYWPRRIARGGEVLAPGTPGAPLQFIDVRDLAAWTLQLTLAGTAGTYHATGPERPLTLGHFLETCTKALDAAPELTWVEESFLLAQGVAPFSEMPLWLPEEAAGFQTNDCSKAIGAGLTFRPLEQTIRDTYEWDVACSDEARAARRHPLTGNTMSPEREREVLEAWRAADVAGSAS
jgi:2'-hydroxyisoflavone reductase